MAVRVAIASGNWSNTATWTGGIVPSAGDDVYSNQNIITIDVNTTVNSINNSSYATPEAIPLMTSNGTPSGVARSNTGTAFQAFDRSSTYWLAQGTVPGDYVEYEFPTPKAIDQYYFTNGTTFNNGSVSLQAWDGTAWITLHTAASVTLPNAGSYTYKSPLIGNSTAYSKYRFVVNSAFYVQIHTVGMYETDTIGTASAGGTFVINDGVNVVANTFNYNNANSSSSLFTHTGTGGTTSLSGNILTYVIQRRFLYLAGTGTFNFTGTIRGESSNEQSVVYSSHSGTLNFTGDIYYLGSGSNAALCNFAGAGYNLTITGNIYNQSTATSGLYALQVLRCSGANSQMTIIGNLYNQTLNITSWDYFSTCLDTTIRTTVIGSLINSATLGYCVASSTDFLFMTGPFVASQYACLPYAARRLFIIPTVNTYFEFVNNSTNGAIPPSVTVSKSRVVSPDSAADAPIPANVRSGVTYLEGNLVGTMAIPNAANVAFGIPVDNTTGTAALDAAGIWAVPLTSINTLNSIGRRVKNAATVETTGAQLESLIRDNE